MTKPIKILLLAAGAVFLLAVVGTFFVLRPAEEQLVEIVQDGEVLYTLDLADAKDQEIVLTTPEGKTNTVTIEDGTIRISHADCPDQTCVKSGVLYSESLPIVCLPHRVIVRFR